MYIINGDDLIINVPMVGLQNAGEVLNKGIEVSASANLSNKLDLNFTYSYISMMNPVYAAPKKHLFLSGNYHL